MISYIILITLQFFKLELYKIQIKIFFKLNQFLFSNYKSIKYLYSFINQYIKLFDEISLFQYPPIYRPVIELFFAQCEGVRKVSNYKRIVTL